MKEYAAPVAYIRRSALRDGGDVSRAFQTEEVRRLAGDDGPRLEVIDGDWGRSGSTDKTDKREAFLGLLDRVEAGEVSALYAYSADRLARSVEWAERLRNACRRAGVPIVTTERRFDPDDDGAAMQWQMWAMMNENYSSQASKKRRASVAVQKRAGAILGQKPYGDKPGEDSAAVVDAFREAGSYHGAVRLLIERGVPSRRAHLGLSWEASTVRRVLLRAIPDELPTHPKRGARTVSTHLFSRLMVCPHDGTLLTTIPHVKEGRAPSYACRAGHRAPKDTHPRPWVISENAIRPVVEATLTGLLDMREVKVADDGTAGDMAAEREKRERVIAAYIDGVVSKDQRDARLAKIDAELAALEAVKRSETVIDSQIDWTAPAGEVNAKLRTLWTGVRLAYVDADGEIVKGRHTRPMTLRAVGAIWRSAAVALAVMTPALPVGTIVDEDLDAAMAAIGGERQEDGTWYVPFAR